MIDSYKVSVNLLVVRWEGEMCGSFDIPSTALQTTSLTAVTTRYVMYNGNACIPGCLNILTLSKIFQGHPMSNVEVAFNFQYMVSY
jgi:hypothetical protein